MTERDADRQTCQEAFKELRKARRQTIEAVTRRMKEQTKAMSVVRRLLKEGSRTIPELAQSADMNPSQVMWIVATLKKYGEVAEGEKDGGYFRYELVGPARCTREG